MTHILGSVISDCVHEPHDFHLYTYLYFFYLHNILYNHLSIDSCKNHT